MTGRLAPVLGPALLAALVAACAGAPPELPPPPPLFDVIVVLEAPPPGPPPGPDDSPSVLARAAAEALVAGRGVVGHVYERVLTGFSLVATEADLELLRLQPGVVAIEPDGPIEAFDETQVNPPWGLDRLDQVERDLDRRYRYQNDGAGVHVYVVDSGLRSRHVDFEGRASNDADLTGGDGSDQNGHGTAVASVVGGRRFGVAKGVRLHGVRVLGPDGKGRLSDLLAGLDWIAAHAQRPAVVTLALGGPRRAVLDDAVAALMQRGLVCVAAAGNADEDVSEVSPASAPGVVAVGAISRDDRRWPLSNWGDDVIYAPGVSIDVAGIGHDAHPDMRSGTSLAAAHVAGVAARSLQLHPSAEQLAVRESVLRRNMSVGIVRNTPGGPAPLLYSGFRAGLFEGVEGDVVEGWVWDPAHPDLAIEVEILAHVAGLLERVAVVKADAFRADLVNRGLGNGAHGFRFTLPEGWSGRQGLAVSVAVAGAGYRLLDPRGMDHIAVGARTDGE